MHLEGAGHDRQLMRNAVILVDQIDRDIAEGAAPGQAIVEATVRRARPVVLMAAALWAKFLRRCRCALQLCWMCGGRLDNPPQRSDFTGTFRARLSMATRLCIALTQALTLLVSAVVNEVQRSL